MNDDFTIHLCTVDLHLSKVVTFCHMRGVRNDYYGATRWLNKATSRTFIATTNLQQVTCPNCVKNQKMYADRMNHFRAIASSA